jgi:dihydroorotase
MNPPLRAKEDVEALLSALIDGTIQAIASDHAPHTAEEKGEDLAAAPFGVVGLETTVGVIFGLLVNPGRLPLLTAIRAMTLGPAQILGISKGTLNPGADADVTIIDPKEEWVVNSGEFASLGRSTPFEGLRLTGRVRHTLVGGRVCF